MLGNSGTGGDVTVIVVARQSTIQIDAESARPSR